MEENFLFMYNCGCFGKDKNGDSMKKWFLLLAIFLCCGCGMKKQTVTLAKLEKPCQELQTDTFNPDRVPSIVEEELLDEKFRNGSVEEWQEILDPTMLDYQLYRTSTTKETEFYIIVKPKQGKEKSVKEAFTTYFNQKMLEANDTEERSLYEKRLEEEHQGYYIYIGSTEGKELLKEIKETNELVFPHWSHVSFQEMETYGFTKEMMKEAMMGISLDLEDDSKVIVIRPEKGKEAEIQKVIETLKQEGIKGDAKELYQDSLLTTVEDATVWIVSKENNKVLDTIKKTLQK